MANITRFSPIEDAFDELFRGFFVRPISFEGQTAPAQFRVDVTESDKAYRMHAEIPGVKKEDINISIDGEHVAISAEVKKEKDVKDGDRMLRAERYYGKVHRAFTLGQAVDETAANAKYADGVLELTLPKKAATSARRIAIQ
ncbi:MAG: heat-shock protein Hsp20 [Betaproteobacteria bacterium RIFCSPLOWO2_12_FULL_62_13]|nr:MAG: heat-shock protein Hsp20 [Betaproteobacteria bacterium RIFCSPLOWO2_12_FULL_62_13]